MERVIELIFDRLVKEICGEGERRIKLQALSVALSTVLGVRKILLVIFIYCFACFLSALSFLGAIFVAVEQKMSGHFIWWDPRLDVCVGVFLLSTLVLAVSVREKRWEGAFGLQRKIDEIERESSRTGFSEADLVRVIERVLDEREDQREKDREKSSAEEVA